ncbi:TetR/AcrR family transcriptional regulator [Alkalibacillus almallahensis]|uniref:TetR/AcrR family transcriptional regulator n=1 Tax=Alkalibacillus almallahensis TaxID=1379154 RepID=UPI0014224610|nr:TetR/AcrR family transcriptional regulator [Alkalibacillus almallahensis]NIK11644.1 AcrR family transcriptional regulator [Alkalibacillus almallahensis]
MTNHQPEQHTAKESINLGLLTLLETKSIDQISVKTIVQHAGVSRSTFYLHYYDKYDLMDQLEAKITDAFLAHFRQEPDTENQTVTIYDVTVNICHHVLSYRAFYQHAFRDPQFMQSLSNLLKDQLIHVYNNRSYATFASYGTIGFLSDWVTSGFQVSPEEAGESLVTISSTDWSQYISQTIDRATHNHSSSD